MAYVKPEVATQPQVILNYMEDHLGLLVTHNQLMECIDADSRQEIFVIIGKLRRKGNMIENVLGNGYIYWGKDTL